MKRLYNTYLRACRQSINQGAEYILIDKLYMVEMFGSVHAGMPFYYGLFVQLSKEFGVKFIISSYRPEAFIVIWRGKDSDD